MPEKINVFVVDDEKAIRDLIIEVLSADKYNLEVFSSADEVLKVISQKEFDVGLIDINMPGMDGIELVKILKSKKLLTELIIITGAASVNTAIESMKLGCYDYLTKPFRLNELQIVIQRAYEKKAVSKENILLKEKLWFRDKYFKIIGKSRQMTDICSLIDKVAITAATILITGETGTGKELVARSIHRVSHASDKSFIVVDCTAIPETLLESELFGHEKGAFTSAFSAKCGLFEIADKGTLFIDEIGEMNLGTQAKLLRAIETRQFRRLGSCKETQVDVRIIAATNRDLPEESETNNFRKDLYYRLNVVNIHLPPLRERKEDISLLVEHFLTNKSDGRITKKISPEAMKTLMDYDWPGNIRELANVIERALIISSGEYIMPMDLPINFTERISLFPTDKKNFDKSVQDFEKQIIVKTLKDCGGNKIKAAKLLSLTRSKLYRKLNEYNIE
jgi:DNA-binding NtrC family response regulator